MRGVRAHLRRRLLISYRVDPYVARALLPKQFRPQIINGHALAGVCVLGVDSVRPAKAGGRWGLRSENAAHRMAVEWDEDGQTHRGVYIFERHSSAWHAVLFGGRLFPGVHRKARFATDESGGRYALTMVAREASLAADVEIGGEWHSEVFATVEDASEFYRSGRVGWSRGHDGVTMEPLTLASEEWAVEGAQLHSLRSSFFDSFPEGAAVFDNVVVMRDLPLLLAVPGSSGPNAAALSGA